MPQNKFVCLVCGSSIELEQNHPANNRAHDGIVYRASCKKCYHKTNSKTYLEKQTWQ